MTWKSTVLPRPGDKFIMRYPDELACLPEAAQCLYEMAFAHIMLYILQAMTGLDRLRIRYPLKVTALVF